MYLQTPMYPYEYIRIPEKLVADKFIQKFNLQHKILHRFLYVEIRKGIYGPPQARTLTNKLLQK